jgi:transcriptional regulator with XRE-family HTH domain
VTDPAGPAIARQRLAQRLRELRKDREIATAVAADAMRWSAPKLNRIENGRVTIEPIAVKALLEYYGVQDDAEIDQLMRLSEISRERPWWRERGVPDEFKEFIGYEAEAAHLYANQASFITGLLQTRDYATAITSLILGLAVSDPAVTEVVNVRMRRQEALLQRLDGDDPPHLTHALDEAVLLRRVGGDRVMADQLDHLLEMMKRPTVRIVILPLTLPGHPGLAAHFELLNFAGEEDDNLVYIESLGTDFLVRNSDDLESTMRTMNALIALGLTNEESAARISAIRQGIKR